MATPDYYKVLGVNKSASHDEIKKAYKKLARKYHPDAGGTEEDFKRISEAYEVLGNEEKRKKYDAFGSMPESGRAYSGKNNPYYGDNYADTIDWHNLYEQVYGRDGKNATSDYDFFDMFNNYAWGNGAYGNSASQQIDLDTNASMSIPLSIAINGGKQRITVDGSTIDISIPKNSGNGQKIKLRGKGRANGKKRGDLIIELSIDMPKGWSLNGKDIAMPFVINTSTAVLGGKSKVVMPDGKTILVNVPPMSHAGKNFVIHGSGIDGGDCILQLVIDIPDTISDKAKNAIENLGGEI